MENNISISDWTPMIISGLAFILSLVSFIYGRKDNILLLRWGFNNKKQLRVQVLVLSLFLKKWSI